MAGVRHRQTIEPCEHFIEGWQPHKFLRKISANQNFLDDITNEILPFTYPVDCAVETVFALPARQCDPGEIGQIIGRLPNELQSLWLKTKRTQIARLAGCDVTELRKGNPP